MGCCPEERGFLKPPEKCWGWGDALGCLLLALPCCCCYCWVGWGGFCWDAGERGSMDGCWAGALGRGCEG